MPLLAAFLSTIFQAIAAFMLKVFLAKLSLRIIGYGLLIAISTAMVVAFNGYIAPLVGQVFNTQYGQFIGLAFPPVAGTCVATLVAAMGGVFAYRLKVRLVTQTTGL